jgi:hypothetical protein
MSAFAKVMRHDRKLNQKKKEAQIILSLINPVFKS